MPRTARRKDPELPSHVMCRSISEIRLFKNDDDKIKYLQLMAKYCEKFECKILAYCLMNTHVPITLLLCSCHLCAVHHLVSKQVPSRLVPGYISEADFDGIKGDFDTFVGGSHGLSSP